MNRFSNVMERKSYYFFLVPSPFISLVLAGPFSIGVFMVGRADKLKENISTSFRAMKNLYVNGV